MPTLADILKKRIARTARSQRYQEALDWKIDALKKTWDLERGLTGTRGMTLPHETIRGYWSLPDAERKALTPPPVQAIYEAHGGREGTSRLCEAAFCWHSPLSRHHGDPDLLRFFSSGLRFFVDSIRDDGFLGMLGFNGLGWAHGWDIEGLIYGLTFCGDALDPALVARTRERFRLSAQRHASLPDKPEGIGSYGNQRCVFALGLYLYGQFLDDPGLVQLADRYWRDAMPCVLDESGQVIEQHGPCMHYSYTSFFYAWLNFAIRGDTGGRQRIVDGLNWFRWRQTESLYPMAGPSTRLYYETMPAVVCDLWPAAEQAASADPSLREFVDRAAAKAAKDAASVFTQAFHHGASVLMWAALMTQDETAAAKPAGAAAAGVTRFYARTRLLKRSPLQYALVRRQYQTHYNFTDYLPFSGIQTWAFGGEPPILHPTPLFPSTTQAWGIDTARQGVSHNWGLYGAGALGIDSHFGEAKADDGISFLIARYDRLWRLVFFTDLSTVALEFGDCGPRRTLWTLNRNEPAEPRIGDGTVRFANRQACLHTTVASRPHLAASSLDHEQARGVRQLVYDCGGGVAAFALSDDSFRFLPGQPLADRVFRFSDAAGRYEAALHDGFLKTENPGNFSIDVWQLGHHGTTARRVG